MLTIRSDFTERSPLDGPPFSIILKEKTKKRLRSIYQIIVFLMILLTIIRYLLVSSILIESYLILFLILFPTFFLVMDNFILLEGNHGNWKVSKIKKIRKWGIVYQCVSTEKIQIEINVVSHRPSSVSLVTVKNIISDIKIKAMNLKVKEFQNDCEIINLRIDIKKRGKQTEDD